LDKKGSNSLGTTKEEKVIKAQNGIAYLRENLCGFLENSREVSVWRRSKRLRGYVGESQLQYVRTAWWPKRKCRWTTFTDNLTLTHNVGDSNRKKRLSRKSSFSQTHRVVGNRVSSSTCRGGESITPYLKAAGEEEDKRDHARPRGLFGKNLSNSLELDLV